MKIVSFHKRDLQLLIQYLLIARIKRLSEKLRFFSANPTDRLKIKTSGSESRGQEEAVCTRISGLRDHYSELFTRMVGLNF